MSNTISIRLPEDLANWLKETSEQTGITQGKIVREQLEKARRSDPSGRKFMHLAGAVDGSPDLSSRKGFNK